MTINKDLTIIIVLYNSSKLIFDCLKELSNFKIIVVDNGKNNHLIDKIKKFQNIEKIISKNKNIGFGNAVNFAFEEIVTEYFLVLNPDIVIKENHVLELLKISQLDKNCAISAPYIPTDKDGYGIFPEKGKNVSRNFLEEKCSKNLENLLPDEIFCADVAKGCALLINSKHFKDVGMFSKEYFLFWEEIDLCRKFRKKKLSIIISPNAIGMHKQGSSSKNTLETFIKKTYHSEISPLYYFKVKKNSLNIYKKIFKYFFRTILYFLILNFKKSLKNLLKLTANINYLFLR